MSPHQGNSPVASRPLPRSVTTPFRDDTTSERGLVGVVLHATVDPNSGEPGAWTEIHRGEVGDPRASSQNNLVLEFLGDYVYASALGGYGVAVWNDVPNGTPCEGSMCGVSRYGRRSQPRERQRFNRSGDLTFGNTDIVG